MLAVSGAAYDSAAEAWAAGATRAGDVVDDLVEGLARTGGMAGDDTTSEDFAAGYDEAAAEVVAALDDLTIAFATLADLVDTSAAHHRAAEARAVLDASVEWVGRGTGDRRVTVREHAPPPSALGADSASTPPLWDLVVDHLQGWAWPSADVDRLRAAAGLWRRTGERVRDLEASIDVAEVELRDQRSPEVPLALAAGAELRRHTAVLAEECATLAQACDDDADRVEETRQAVEDLLQGLAAELALTATGGVVLGMVTFGLGTAAALTAATARTLTCARRIAALLATLRSLRAACVAARTLPRVRSVRTGLLKFRNVEQAAAASNRVHTAPWQVIKKFRRHDDASWRNLVRHFDVHGKQFPDLVDADAYDRALRGFLSDPPWGTRTIVRQDGSVVRWHERSNTFAIMSADGAPQTMYRLDPAVHGFPRDIDYFRSQLDR